MPKALNVNSNRHPISSSSLGRTIWRKPIGYKRYTPSRYNHDENNGNERVKVFEDKAKTMTDLC